MRWLVTTCIHRARGTGADLTRKRKIKIINWWLRLAERGGPRRINIMKKKTFRCSLLTSFGISCHHIEKIYQLHLIALMKYAGGWLRLAERGGPSQTKKKRAISKSSLHTSSHPRLQVIGFRHVKQPSAAELKDASRRASDGDGAVAPPGLCWVALFDDEKTTCMHVILLATK